MVANPWEVFISCGIAALIIAFIVSKGITKGIERFSKIIMPILIIMLTY